MLYALAGAAGLLALIFIFTSSNPRRVWLFLVGASAGLQNVQIHKIHLFVFVVLMLVLFGSRRDGFHLNSRAFLIPIATGILCISVLLGTQVNSYIFEYQLLLLSIAAGLVGAVLREGEMKVVLAGLLFMVSVGSGVALLQYGHILHLPPFHGLRRPRGIYTEPDFLGIYAAVGTVLSVRAPVSSNKRILLVLLNITAVTLTQARGAWLGLLIAGFLAILLSRNGRNVIQRQKGTLRILGAILLVGVLGLSLDGAARSSIASRISSATSSTPDKAAITRQDQTAALFFLARQEPWHGFGLSASGRAEPNGQIRTGGASPLNHNVSTDWLLGWWVDGGFLALPIIALFLYAAFRRLPETVALAFLAVLIDCLVANATAYPITWILLGLVMSIKSVKRDDKKDSQADGHHKSEMYQFALLARDGR